MTDRERLAKLIEEIQKLQLADNETWGICLFRIEDIELDKKAMIEINDLRESEKERRNKEFFISSEFHSSLSQLFSKEIVSSCKIELFPRPYKD